jgi:hypothetical protein
MRWYLKIKIYLVCVVTLYYQGFDIQKNTHVYKSPFFFVKTMLVNFYYHAMLSSFRHILYKKIPGLNNHNSKGSIIKWAERQLAKWKQLWKNSATFTHLSVLTIIFIPLKFYSILFWLKKDESEFVDIVKQPSLNESFIVHNRISALSPSRFYFNL